MLNHHKLGAIDYNLCQTLMTAKSVHPIFAKSSKVSVIFGVMSLKIEKKFCKMVKSPLNLVFSAYGHMCTTAGHSPGVRLRCIVLD